MASESTWPGSSTPAATLRASPALLALALDAGVESALAAHRVNAVSGALLVLLVAGAAWRMGGVVAAGAGQLVARVPASVRNSVSKPDE